MRGNNIIACKSVNIPLPEMQRQGAIARLKDTMSHLGEPLWSVDECADLGCSSEYSMENIEGRSGEGFRVNSIWTWVSRS